MVAPSANRGTKSGLEAVLVGVVCLMIALVAAASSESPTARFFTGVLVGMSAVAIVAGAVSAARRRGRPGQL